MYCDVVAADLPAIPVYNLRNYPLHGIAAPTTLALS